MNEEKINKNPPALRILIAPLDWGLGHATRCIPIINYLSCLGIQVILAGEGETIEILRKTQPETVILPLKGYRVRYSRKKNLFFLHLLAQFPKIMAAVFHERKWLKKAIAEYNIDAVISDNRFGLSNPGIPSVFITHQLAIKTGIKWLDALAAKINYRFIEKFNECWVPDTESEPNFAGALSHPVQRPRIPVKYLGVLSRFKTIPAEKIYDLLILLSGPEPQRSIFENMLLQQVNGIKGKIAIVRGLPLESGALPNGNTQLTLFNHLPAEELNRLVLQSKHIVCRCGYSTVMDLVTLQKHAVLVPTPGQTEQEYLASYLEENNLFITRNQENFSLEKAVSALQESASALPAINPHLHKEIINNWVGGLMKHPVMPR